MDTIRKRDETGGPAALSRRRFLVLVTIGLTGTAAISVATACAPAAAPGPTAAPAAQPTEAPNPAAPAAAPTTPPGGAPATAAPAVSSGAAFGKPEDPSPELWWVRDVQMSGGWPMAAENAAAAAIGQQKSFFE